MSVLVEALSLIIPRKVLEVSYPGGTETFMKKMCQPDIPARLVCADEKLVSVSFLGPDDARTVGMELCDLGIVAADGDCFQEFAFVDQADGPTLRCDWLEWRHHPEGFTYCWLAGSDPEEIHAPENWTPEQSLQLAQHDMRDEPSRCLRLAVEETGEVWLDFQTGEITDKVPPRASWSQSPAGLTPAKADNDSAPTEAAVDGAPSMNALVDIVAASLQHQGFTFARTDSNTIQLTIRATKAVYFFVFSTTVELQLIELMGTIATVIPQERRPAIAELASRMNVLLRLGKFELDFDSGALQFRATTHAPDGAPSEAAIRQMLAIALHFMDQRHDAIMRVAFGEVAPESVL